MARLSSELVLTLRDGVSGPARRVESSLGGLERKARAHVRMTAAISKASTSALAGMASALTPAAVAFGAQQSFVRFAAAERMINRIGVTAGATAEETKRAQRAIDQMSFAYAMGQDQVTAGLDSLVAAGRSMKEAMSFLPSVVATAQASGAEVADIATTADAVGNGFDIAGDKMQNAFDILVMGGKLGKFELKDMARYLPSMVPAFEALGYKGEAGLKKLTAALQVVRAGTGSSEEAATSFANVIQKMESDETVKNFAEFGIDLRKSLARARRDGRDLLDVFIELSAKATKGDMSKIPQLFADAEMQRGMRALLNGVPMLADYFGQLGSAAGSTARDVKQVLSDSQTDIDRLSSSWDRLIKTVGAGIAPGVTTAMDAISNPVQQALDERAGDQRLAGAGIDEAKVRARHAELWQQLHGSRFWGQNSSDIVGDFKRAKAAYGRGESDDPLDGLRKSLAGPRTKDDYVGPAAVTDLGDGGPLRRGIPTPSARPNGAAPTPEQIAETGLSAEIAARDRRLEDGRRARLEGRGQISDDRRVAGADASQTLGIQRMRAMQDRIAVAANALDRQSEDVARRKEAAGSVQVRGANLDRAAELGALVDGLRQRLATEVARRAAAGSFAPVVDSRIDQLNNRIGALTAQIAELNGAGLRESRTKDDYVGPIGSGRDALAGIVGRFDASPAIAETERAAQAAEAAGNRMSSALNVTAAPQVDASAIDALNMKVNTARENLRLLGAETNAAAQRASNRLPGTTFDDAHADIEN